MHKGPSLLDRKSFLALFVTQLLSAFALYQSMWSRKDGGPLRLPRRLRGRVFLRFGAPMPAEGATAAGLEALLRRMLGEEAPAP